MATDNDWVDWRERIRDIFDNKIPFNRMLGLRVHSLEMNRPKIRFEMTDALPKIRGDRS